MIGDGIDGLRGVFLCILFIICICIYIVRISIKLCLVLLGNDFLKCKYNMG